MEHTKKVLVLDDEVHIRRVISLKLENRGYRVVMGTNGEEGLDIITEQKPDVVISDIMMPKLDGRSLCEKVNGLKKERSFLTIMMTCRISPDEANWMKGMTDTVFMEKPFSPSKIVECIEEYFRGDA